MRKKRYFTLEKRLSIPFGIKLAVPLVSIVAGFLFSAFFLVISGESPLEVYSVMLDGAFGSAYGLSETVVKMIPLMIISVGVAFAFKMQIWNAGGEGQLHIGAAAATYVVLHLNGCSRFVTILAAFLAAFICAGIYGLIPAILKVKWKVNELITCLMLNYVATFLIAWLIQGPWKDPSGFAFPRTRKFPASGELTTLFDTRIHTGLLIGLAIAVILWFVISKTRWGYEIKPSAQRKRSRGTRACRSTETFCSSCSSVRALRALPAWSRSAASRTACRRISPRRSVRRA